MNEELLIKILESYKTGDFDREKALEELRDLPFKNLDYACLDNHRALRVGYPEVIYCSGKSNEQIRGIYSYFLKQGNSILGTRASEENYEYIRDLSEDIVFDPSSRTLTVKRGEQSRVEDSYIAVVTAGTSDIPVAEEAAVTAEFFGSRVERIYDVGVAGIHRLFGRIDLIRGAKVIIVAAGMEGALASVVGGLVNAPLIAVPTSVGYGASFNGLSALLTMLNSCASGISVVNIDNGFGAAYQADMINRL